MILFIVPILSCPVPLLRYYLVSFSTSSEPRICFGICFSYDVPSFSSLFLSDLFPTSLFPPLLSSSSSSSSSFTFTTCLLLLHLLIHSFPLPFPLPSSLLSPLLLSLSPPPFSLLSPPFYFLYPPLSLLPSLSSPLFPLFRLKLSRLLSTMLSACGTGAVRK